MQPKEEYPCILLPDVTLYLNLLCGTGYTEMWKLVREQGIIILLTAGEAERLVARDYTQWLGNFSIRTTCQGKVSIL